MGQITSFCVSALGIPQSSSDVEVSRILVSRGARRLSPFARFLCLSVARSLARSLGDLATVRPLSPPAHLRPRHHRAGAPALQRPHRAPCGRGQRPSCGVRRQASHAARKRWPFDTLYILIRARCFSTLSNLVDSLFPSHKTFTVRKVGFLPSLSITNLLDNPPWKNSSFGLTLVFAKYQYFSKASSQRWPWVSRT